MRRGNAGTMEITGKNTRLAPLVNNLSDLAGRTVLDKTGLTGNYDFKLVFTRDMGRVDGAPEPAGDSPSLFTALQEQLGLRLDAQKGPVEVLVIDSAEKASGN